MTSNYEQLVERLAGVRVLVIGDAMLDHYIVGRIDRISPEAPVPILGVEQEFDRLGGAANVAANVAALGGAVRLICLAGRDRDGRPDPDADRLEQKCRDLGISACLLRCTPCTVCKTRILAGRQQVLRIDWEEPFNRTSEEQERARQTGAILDPLPLNGEARQERERVLAQALLEADTVLVSDYAKGMVDADLMQQLRSSGKPIVVDPRPQHVDLYHGVHAVTPNRSEAARMLGLDPRRQHAPESMATLIAQRLQCSALLTLGEDGMFLRTVEGRTEEIPTRAREVFDVTGAGDTVAAVVALGVGAGIDLPSAAHLANAAAGVVVGHVGTASVTSAELKRSFQSEYQILETRT